MTAGGGPRSGSLECRACGRTYEEGRDEPWRCECGHALDVADRPLPDRFDVRPEHGLWTFAPFLPAAPRVSLGEGFTPLADAPDWDARFKLDYVLPSGSFKDRGATVLLSRAAELGVERVLEDSSGNAGAAVAQYAARAGIDAEIYVPADAKPSKLRAIEAAGATPVRVEGSRGDVTAACVDAVERGEGWYASHAWNPVFYAGMETFAYELAVQRDWTVPDAVVLPVGHGTLLLGASRGFVRLRDAGWTERVPRLYGVQAAGVTPVLDEFRAEHSTATAGGDAAGANDVADGIQVGAPARLDQVVDAVETSGGDVIAVDADATERELAALHGRGFYCEPTSAVAPAGLRVLRERGAVDPDEDVVVPLTGSGVKS